LLTPILTYFDGVSFFIQKKEKMMITPSPSRIVSAIYTPGFVRKSSLSLDLFCSQKPGKLILEITKRMLGKIP
jgi:hypothetical protein